MITQTFSELYVRDLNKLKEEISLFKNETDIWITQGDVKNSPGNLALHLTGNLKHFIGAQLGNTGYIRQRDKEFSDKNVPREQLIQGIEEAKQIVNDALSSLSEEDLQKNFPIEFLGKQYKTIEILFILYGHFNYHLGQINYQRRLLSV